MFLQVGKIFSAYIKKRLSCDGIIADYDAEIRKKLSQLSWIISRAVTLNRQVLDSLPIVDSGEIQEPDGAYDIDAMYELEIITESFYHFAWRLQEILRHHPVFDEVKKSLCLS